MPDMRALRHCQRDDKKMDRGIMKKQLTVLLTIVLVGILGLLSLPIGGVEITTSDGHLSVSTNVALAVNTIPPEEPVRQSYSLTEEQTAHNAVIALYSGSRIRAGQRLTISNRIVTKLSFPIRKFGSPTGNVTFTIRKVSDDSVLASKVWGDASALPTTVTWEEITFDSPININEEVRIQVEFSGGDSSNTVRYRYQDTDVKASELHTRYITSYTDRSGNDGAYIYTYSLPVVPPTITNGVGATNITTTTARLNGNLTDNGGENCTVHIYWGDNDGITNSSNWDTDENLGTQGNGTFYKDVTNLTLNTTYYYRCYANNSAGSDWADSTANFTTLPGLPTVGEPVVTASMTPQSQAWVNVTITDNNKLSDLSTVETVLFYDADGSYTDPGASPTPDTKTLAIMTWYASNDTFTIQSGSPSTWSVNNTTSTHDALTGTTGDWKFSFQPSKVATETTGSAKWFARVNATDSAALVGSNHTTTGSDMQWYGEITVETSNISWGTVTPGCTDVVQVTPTAVNITYICNGNYNEQGKTSQNWTSASGNVTLNTTGSPGTGEFSLKADDDDTIEGAVQVLSASYTTFDTGNQTTESGNVENNNHLWLSLGLGIPVDTYSGTIYFGIA